MKRFFLLLSILCIAASTFAQAYSGSTNNKYYSCWLKINSDSSIVFVQQDKQGYMYQEYEGRMHHTHDSVYHISCTCTFSAGINKKIHRVNIPGGVNNTDYFMFNIPFDTATIKYANGTTKKLVPADFNAGFEFALDSSLFNSKPANNHYSYSFGHKNPVSGKEVIFVVPHGSSPGIYDGFKEEFDIAISADKVHSISGPLTVQTGHFELRKKKKW